MLSKLPKNVMYSLLDQLQDAIFVIENGVFVCLNHQTLDLLGYTEEELISHSFADFIYEKDRLMVMERHKRRLQGEDIPSDYSFHIYTKQGKVRKVHVKVSLVSQNDGKLYLVGSLRDITEQSKIQQQLKHTQADIDSILSNMPDVFYRTDMNGIITMMSPSCFNEIGYKSEEMIGRPMADFYFSPEERDKIVQALIEGDGQATQVEHSMQHKDGHPIWVSTNAFTRKNDNGKPMCIEGISRNITERKKMEDKLLRLTRYDSLTQAFTRRQFYIEAENQMAIAKRYKRPIALAMIDLDRFKSINDTLGHIAGDKVLKSFSNHCRKLLRSADLFGRMGGEEFVILMPETTLKSAYETLNRLQNFLTENPTTYKEKSIQISFSAGIISAQSPAKQSLEELIQQADELMYVAKNEGRARIKISP